MTLPFSQQVTADATCRLLQAGSGLAANIAVTSVFTGQIWGAVAGTAGAIGMEALGRSAGCYNNPDDNPDFPSSGPSYMTGCRKIGSGFGTLHMYDRNGREEQSSVLQYTEMVNIEFKGYGNGTSSYRYQYIDRDGVLQDVTRTWFDQFASEAPFANGKPFSDSTCAEQAEDEPVQWQPDTPIGPTYEYTDPETGCTWQIKPYDVYLDSAGKPVFHWKAVSDDPVSCGGPYEWWGNGQDPDIPNFPTPCGDDCRPIPPPIPPGPGTDIKEKLDDILERLDELEKCACPEKPELAKHWRSIRCLLYTSPSPRDS